MRYDMQAKLENNHLRCFGLGVERWELFNVQFAIAVFVELFQQNELLAGREVERVFR